MTTKRLSDGTASTNDLVRPHGGALVDRFISPDAALPLLDRAHDLPAVVLDAREQADLELIATGAASPLIGFLGRADYDSVLLRRRLANGIVWPLPFTLAVTDEVAATLASGAEAALREADGRLLGVIRVEETFTRDPLAEAAAVYGTTDPSHPGVAYLLARPRNLVAGPVLALPLPDTIPFAAYRFTPRELRQEIAARGWRRVAGFQTRNPIHRAHEHLTKLALEVADGLVIHPLVGETKADDVPAAVRFRAYEALIERYYPPQRTLLAAFPAAMRYAGPREALFHVLVRKNYGITHLIVGRDHAGVGSYYGPFDAHALLDRFSEGEIGVTPLRLDAAFYCRDCGQLASARTCPHEAGARLELSGSRVRELLRSGAELPREFTRPEVAEVLRAHAGGAAAPPPLLPLFLKLGGRRVLLVGGGRVAAAKLEPLVAAGAAVTVVAPEVRPELERAGVAIERRAFAEDDLDGAWLVVTAATADVNRRVAAAAEARRVFVCAVDDPQTGSAYAPAVVRRGGIAIARSTEGQGPGLAALLREALDTLLPDELGQWTQEARRQRARWKADGVPFAARRPLLLEALNRLYDAKGAAS
jgi:ATP sulfurylase